MRPLPNLKALACPIALLICVAAGCSSSDDSSAGDTGPAPSVASQPQQTDALPTRSSPTDSAVPGPAATGASPTSAAPAPPAEPGVIPSTDPCDLLTAGIAEQTLGVPVGEPISQPGEGNTSCLRRPADPAAKGMIVLTLYGVEGTEAVLDGAAAQFPGAVAVDDLGDAARVSVESQVIGVLSGSTVFAIGLYPQQVDGQLLPVSQDQLVSVARAVLDGQ